MEVQQQNHNRVVFRTQRHIGSLKKKEEFFAELANAVDKLLMPGEIEFMLVCRLTELRNSKNFQPTLPQAGHLSRHSSLDSSTLQPELPPCSPSYARLNTFDLNSLHNLCKNKMVGMHHEPVQSRKVGTPKPRIETLQSRNPHSFRLKLPTSYRSLRQRIQKSNPEQKFKMTLSSACHYRNMQTQREARYRTECMEEETEGDSVPSVLLGDLILKSKSKSGSMRWASTAEREDWSRRRLCFGEGLGPQRRHRGFH